MKRILFGERVEPACQYCEHGVTNKENPQEVLCIKHGVMDLADHCKSYMYAPLRRIPKRAPALPKFSHKDFSL